MKTSCLILAAIVGAFLFGSAPLARADEASHLQAARDVLAAAHMDRIFSRAIDQVVDAQMQANPQLAQNVRGLLRDFLTKYMGWDALKEDIAQLYAKDFSEDELKQIGAFYGTPTGAKTLEVVPALMAQAMALGQSRVQAHLPEFKALVDRSAAAQNSQTPATATAAPTASSNDVETPQH